MGTVNLPPHVLKHFRDAVKKDPEQAKALALAGIDLEAGTADREKVSSLGRAARIIATMPTDEMNDFQKMARAVIERKREQAKHRN